MNATEFQKLLNKCTQETGNVRAYVKNSYSSVSRVPDEIANKIAAIVSFLQASIDKGLFCKPDEYVMIYNFQPLYVSDSAYLCSLDMVIRSKDKIHDLETCDGKPFQLVVDGKNGKIVNNAYAEREMGLYDEEEDEIEKDEIEHPTCYGNFFDYLKPSIQGFKEKLEALQSSLDSNETAETKMLREFQSFHKLFVAVQQEKPKSMTFAYDSRFAQTPSPTAPLDLSSIVLPEKDNVTHFSSMLTCMV